MSSRKFGVNAHYDDIFIFSLSSILDILQKAFINFNKIIESDVAFNQLAHAYKDPLEESKSNAAK